MTAFDLPFGSGQHRLELICSFLSRTEAERMPGSCEQDPHVGHTLKDTQSFFEKSKPRQVKKYRKFYMESFLPVFLPFHSLSK